MSVALPALGGDSPRPGLRHDECNADLQEADACGPNMQGLQQLRRPLATRVGIKANPFATVDVQEGGGVPRPQLVVVCEVGAQTCRAEDSCRSGANGAASVPDSLPRHPSLYCHCAARSRI